MLSHCTLAALISPAAAQHIPFANDDISCREYGPWAVKIIRNASAQGCNVLVAVDRHNDEGASRPSHRRRLSLRTAGRRRALRRLARFSWSARPTLAHTPRPPEPRTLPPILVEGAVEHRAHLGTEVTALEFAVVE